MTLDFFRHLFLFVKQRTWGKPTGNFSLPNDHQTHIWCVCNKDENVVGARTGGQNKRVIIPVVGGRGRGGESLMGGEEI